MRAGRADIRCSSVSSEICRPGAVELGVVTRFDEPLKRVVGDKTAAPLESALGVATVGELLRHYPRRYAERGELTSIASLENDEIATVRGRVSAVQRRPMKNRHGTWLDVEVTDGKDRIHLAFFGKGAFVAEQRLLPGTEATFSGKVNIFVSPKGAKRRSLTHPDYVTDDEETSEEFATAPVPIYPSAQSLASWKIGRAVRLILDTLSLDDPLPSDLRGRHNLIGLAEALTLIHRPRDQGDIARARSRLKFDEAFTLQAVLARRRIAADALPAKPRPGAADGLLGRVRRAAAVRAHRGPAHGGGGDRRRPRGATIRCTACSRARSARARPWWPCGRCSRSPTPAVRPRCSPPPRSWPSSTTARSPRCSATWRAAACSAARPWRCSPGSMGRRAAAEPARRGVRRGRDRRRHPRAAAGQGPVRRPGAGRGRRAAPLRRRAARRAAREVGVRASPRAGDDGDPDPPNGRHDRVRRPRGVDAVAAPVGPRADHDPRGARRREAPLPGADVERVREEVGLGRQAYIVCPRIGDLEGDEGDLTKDADERRPPLAVPRRGRDAGLRVRSRACASRSSTASCRPRRRTPIMRSFTRGEIDVLVATTVIEVGVDVPNSSVMIIMDADRFGVSQLHQLRGRVGRGGLPGLCLLVSETMPGTPARERLDAVASTLDGFELSRVDLEQRREGDVLGAAQSGPEVVAADAPASARRRRHRGRP